jgi:hypothetical protein
MAIQGVETGVQFASLEPTIEGGFGPIEYTIPLLRPLYYVYLRVRNWILSDQVWKRALKDVPMN